MEGTSLHLDGDGVDPNRHALYHFLCKAVLAVNTKFAHEGNIHTIHNMGCCTELQISQLNTRCMQVYLWPAVIAIGEGPLGGRGSSHVLISTSTLSKNCTKEETIILRIQLSKDK